jgi:hypothetical protein
MRLSTTTLLIALLATTTAQAACLDLPNKLLMYARKGPSVQIVDLTMSAVGEIKLDCSLEAKDWGKLALPLHVCTDTSVPNPGGGQCKVTDVKALSGAAPNGGDFEYVIRRNFN